MASSSLRHPIKLGDKTFEVSPLNDISREALDEWVRSQFVERVLPIINGLASEKDRQLALDRAFDKSLSLTWMSGEGAKLMGTVKGVARMLYEGIRPNHPEIRFEDLCSLLFNPENVRLANAAFRQLNVRQQEKTKDKQVSSKKRSPSPRKKFT